ncbi:hypothetical protein [Rhizobium sp. LCM 4573]|uniref:hypothetical protein n=1 Tax=Rhizobium sp. LCM 4573 TaxID=1848291 RepID=UPI0012FFA42B|nr:hypothetical protein [Rhizobium sp. LCM 4573]
MSSLELTSASAAKRTVMEKSALRQGLMAAGVCLLMLGAAVAVRLLAAASVLSLW